MDVNLRALVGKLYPTCRAALEGAAGLCLARTHYDVGIEHLLIKLLDVPDADVALLLRHYEIDSAKMARDLTRALDDLKRDNPRAPALGADLFRLLCDTWLIASLDYADGGIRSGYMICALVRSANLRPRAAQELSRISEKDLTERVLQIVAPSVESGEKADENRPAAGDTKIFLSYRREDAAGYARAIHRELEDGIVTASVFMDVEATEPGADFVEELDKALDKCAVLIALITKNWLAPSAADEHGQGRQDYVRLELARALARKIRVIPVLLDGAVMPRAHDLPEDLRAFVRRNAVEVSHTTFREDMQRLVLAVQKILATAQRPG